MTQIEFIENHFDRLKQAGDESVPIGVLLVRLHRVKEVQSVFGLKTGSRFVHMVRELIENAMRPVDELTEVCIDEFVLLLPGLKNKAQAILAANKIVDVLSDPLKCDGQTIHPRVSIGIAYSEDSGDSFDDLIRHANIALENARHTDEGYILFSEDLLPEELPDQLLEQEMHFAYEHDEFALYYQPKIHLADNRLIGAEALIRWFSSRHGFINTQRFIDVLEDSQLLLSVTKWVVNTAVRQCKTIQQHQPNFTMAINVSPALLDDMTIVDLVQNATGIWGLDPASLIIEVTEGAIIKNPERSLSVLHAINELGASVSIDDFGTGQSSMMYLSRLPAAELKIDKSFVINMNSSDNDAKIVKATIDLAHNLGMQVTAEGVENEETMTNLIAMQCDKAQGYYLARPMDFDVLLAYLDNI